MVEIVADKPSGNVVFKGEANAKGTTGGTVDNHGTLHVAAGEMLECEGYVDHPDSVLDGDGTLKTKFISKSEN